MKARSPVRSALPGLAPSHSAAVALAAVLGFGLPACSSDSRNEPSPPETCRQLAEECAGLDFGRSADCAELGEQGLADSQYEDQCFVFYDGCIDECRWIKLWDRTGGTDADEAGADGQSDAASTDEVSPEAGLPFPDAGASTDASTAG